MIWFSCKFIIKINQRWIQPRIKFWRVFCQIFDYKLKWKRSRAKPSWKYFSSSYGSSQLGSDSSLVSTAYVAEIHRYRFSLSRKTQFWICYFVHSKSLNALHIFQCRKKPNIFFGRNNNWICRIESPCTSQTTDTQWLKP